MRTESIGVQGRDDPGFTRVLLTEIKVLTCVMNGGEWWPNGVPDTLSFSLPFFIPPSQVYKSNRTKAWPRWNPRMKSPLGNCRSMLELRATVARARHVRVPRPFSRKWSGFRVIIR